MARVHFIGIGGIGMCGLAELLHNMGARVSGSDMNENPQTLRLKEMGIDIRIGHHTENVQAKDVVVYSSAIRPTNPEYQEARRLKIPLIPRAESLAEIMRLKRGIAVGGSHGKTTSTSMLAAVFLEAKADPTIVVGGRLDLIKSTALLGEGQWMIAEADESDGSFSRLSPEVAMITNIDNDHLDHYGTFEHLKKAFFDFAGRVPFYGVAVICWDDAVIRETFAPFGKRLIRYGFHPEADLRIAGGNSRYQVFFENQLLGEVKLNVPGRHNALNAAGAMAVALEAGISFSTIVKGLEHYHGVDRRFQFKGRVGNIDVYDDYGHHPTEIEAVLSAYRERFGERPLIVAFQPHRFSRTKLCWNQFQYSFKMADRVYLADIYAAGEEPISGINSDSLLESIATGPKEGRPRLAESGGLQRIHSQNGLTSVMSETAMRLAKDLYSEREKSPVLFTLGAGDIWKLSDQVLLALENLKKESGD